MIDGVTRTLRIGDRDTPRGLTPEWIVAAQLGYRAAEVLPAFWWEEREGVSWGVLLERRALSLVVTWRLQIVEELVALTGIEPVFEP